MKKIPSLVCALCTVISFDAMSNPIKTVGTAVVNKNAHTVEMRSGWSSDADSNSHDGRFQTRQLYDYGMNDFYAIRMTLVQDDGGSDNFEHNSVMLDNRFQIFEKNEHGFDGGFRASYVYRDGDKKPDLVEIRWINQIPLREYEFRHHIIVQHQIGQDSRVGIMPELRWQLTAPISRGHRAGVEMFNEFGNIQDKNSFDEQSHDAGVVFTGPLWNDNVRYQAGYRHGISDHAPDHSVKFFVGYNF